jgi:hypothetical protein
MEIRLMDFWLGFVSGAGLGIVGALAAGRLRYWLGRSEAGRLALENRELKRRLAAKDRHIARMLTETERLAEKLGKTALPHKEEARLPESKAQLALTGEESK